MRKNARLQRPAHTRRYKGKGRRPIYGLPLPKPPQMLADRRRKVHKVRFHSYQGKQEVRRVVEVFGTYSEIAGEMPLRFVLVKPLHKKEDPLFLVTTDLTSSLVEILKDVVSRWTIEVCFREAKQAMGVEKNQVWARESVQRMTPFGFWLMGMIKVWYLLIHQKLPSLRLEMPWYKPGGRVSFAQMQASLRYFIYKELLNETTQENPIFEQFGLDKDLEKRNEWILRNFCGC